MSPWKKRKNRISTSWVVLVVCAFAVTVFGWAIGFSDGNTYQYESLGRRDPFVPLVGVTSRRESVRGLEGILSIEDVSLQGILVGPDGSRSVIINGEVVEEGKKIGTLMVESIKDNEVTVRIDEDTHTLKLYEQ
jgi:hypothetical protein